MTVNVISLGGLSLFPGGTARRSTRLATVAAGASCANLITPAQGSIFTVGQYTLISGFDMQGGWQGGGFGNPPNPHYFEWPIVSAVDTAHNCDGSAGGSVSFSAPLVNTYKSTWPLYDAGTGVNNIGDEGGPATLYVLDPSWDSTIDVRGLTLSHDTFALNITSRTVKLTDVAMSGAGCVIPSVNQTWTNTNVTGASCNLEVDKIVSSFVWNGGSVNIVRFQSSSINLFSASNMTFSQLIGTPKKFTGSNLTIGTFQAGATSFGRTDEIVCTTCTINSFSSGGTTETGPLVAGTWTLPGQNSGSYAATMSGGVISVANTHGAVTWAVPGTNVAFGGTNENEIILQIADVTQDAAFTYIATTLASGFPAIPLTGNSLGIRVHAAPKFTCTSCNGSDPQIASLTQAPAGAPLYSQQTYVYPSSIGGTGQPVFHQWGNLSQLSINVTSSYGGAGAAWFHEAQFDNWPVLKNDLTQVNYGPNVDMKVAGNRVITLSGVTGGQPTDCNGAGIGCLTVPDSIKTWFPGPAANGAAFSTDLSSICPACSVTVTLQTSQGVVNPP